MRGAGGDTGILRDEKTVKIKVDFTSRAYYAQFPYFIEGETEAPEGPGSQS